MNNIVKELKKWNIHLRSFEKIGGGINSKVFKAKDTKGVFYAIKIYKTPSFSDKRERRINEINFYEYLSMCNIRCIPRLVSTSEANNFSIYSWIDGEKITDPTKEDLQQVVEFMMAINNYNCRLDYSRGLPLASDAYKSSFTPALELKQRMDKYLKKRETQKSLDSSLVNMVSKEILRSSKEAITSYMDNLSDKIWGIAYKPSYVSPSDIGFHNIIKSKSGKIHFIDFEYGGLDDISKLIADLTCNPNHKFSNHEENHLLESISNSNLLNSKPNKILDEHWLDRYRTIKPLVELKWCFIMINRIELEYLDSEIEKINSYYRAMSSNIAT